MRDLTTLERPLYGFAQVDDLLGLRSGTARRWIDGYERSARSYPPVIRPEPSGAEAVTWGEFVETSLLARYRGAGVPMQRLRPVVQMLREQLGVAYPLAHARPWVAERELVVDVQRIVELEPALFLVVVPRTGQLAIAPRADDFVARVEWEDDIAGVYRIYSRSSPVMVDPLRSFGAPTVSGIRTDVLAELVEAGEPRDDVAMVYELQRGEVDAAVEFERARRVA